MSGVRQQQLRLLPGSRIMWVNPECEWQGGSRDGCNDDVSTLTVTYEFPTHFERRVRVCSHHVLAFVRQARKTGHVT